MCNVTNISYFNFGQKARELIKPANLSAAILAIGAVAAGAFYLKQSFFPAAAADSTPPVPLKRGAASVFQVNHPIRGLCKVQVLRRDAESVTLRFTDDPQGMVPKIFRLREFEQWGPKHVQ